MPYHWTESPRETSLMLWPHQSLTPRGFTWFIGTSAAMLTLPLVALLGSPVVWILMFFFIIAMTAMWRAITANQRDRSRHEELVLTEKHIRLEHVPHAGPVLEWDANRHWVTVNLRKDGPVENYLTLRGNGREVELGRFLTPEEREALYDEILTALRD